MARRIRHGLDYFPLDTSWDMNMRILKSEYGIEGIGVVILLFQMIYHEGYYINWNGEAKKLFCSENCIEEAKLDTILEFCIDHGLFDRGLYEQYSVLTSWAIQRQWLRICIDAKRKEAIIAPHLNLCPEMNKESDAQASGITPENSRKNRENSGKPRGLSEERKEKEKKENKSDLAEFCQQPAQSAKEIPALIQSLAEEKRAFPNGPPNAKEPIFTKFQQLIGKNKSQ
jgi:hypothetical protein